MVVLLVSQVVAFFQLQGQFIWSWVKDNPVIVSVLGIPISWMLITFTKYCAMAFGGQSWPGRLIGFAVGAVVFAILSNVVLKEPLTIKTIVCLFLALCILLIQILWK